MKFCRLAFSVSVPLSIFLAILATVQGDADPNSSEYCTTIKCKIAAFELIHAQNRSVNPCEDFYKHACTGSRSDHLFYRNLRAQIQITKFFKDIQPDDLEALTKAKKFQDACANRSAITRLGLRPIAKILSENGEWPLTVPSDEWNDQFRSWQEIHENFVKSTGISALIDVTVEAHPGNTSFHILSLGVPIVPSERAISFSRTKRETRDSDYREYLFGVVGELQELRAFNVTYDDLLADLEGVIAFEDELVKLAIALDKDYVNENGDDLRITMIETLQNEWDVVVPKVSTYSINWLKVINDRFEGTDIVIDACEKIALKPAAFVANFASLLMKTPVRTIVNFIHWKVIDNLLDAASSRFWNKHAKPRAMFTSPEGYCLVRHKMLHAVSYLYVKRHPDIESMTGALEIVQNIKEEIKREIGESSWLDEETKSVIREKVDAMKGYVGYPEWYDEPGKIDEYYREFTVGPDHFENVLAYNKFASKKQLSKLRSPVDETETDWLVLPFNANADYLPQRNAISIPATILQRPFFVYERPSVLNYGSLGAIAGHEVSHGLDNHGRLWDGAGVKRKWWSQSAIDKYKTKAQCFVKQYDKYTVDIDNQTFHLNGTETLAENIADTMGFRAGLKAYQRLRNEGKTNNVKLQRLGNFTDEQLYFYQLTYTFCEEEPVWYIETGTLNAHSPDPLRIMGVLSNMQEFAEAFHCPPGSPMNPPEKCLIWD